MKFMVNSNRETKIGKMEIKIFWNINVINLWEIKIIEEVILQINCIAFNYKNSMFVSNNVVDCNV